MFKISKEKQLEINEFLKEHISKYPEDIQEYIKENIFDEESFIDVILQLYSYKKAILNELNPYYQLVDLLKSKFDSLETKNITEVSCGFIPALSIALNSSIQRKNPIHVYDPLLIDIPYPNIINHKNNFHSNLEPNSNLLIANLPCEALDIIVNTAIQNKKEFAVQTCPCNGEMIFYSFAEFNYYVDSLFYRLLELEDNGFIVEKEKTDFSRLSGYPVLLARKKNVE